MTEEIFDQPSELMLVVVNHLKSKRDKDLLEIWKATGVPYFWLRKLASGRISNPGVNRTQFLYEYFTGKKLRVDGFQQELALTE
jgi:hypothetical protein